MIVISNFLLWENLKIGCPEIQVLIHMKVTYVHLHIHIYIYILSKLYFYWYLFASQHRELTRIDPSGESSNQSPIPQGSHVGFATWDLPTPPKLIGYSLMVIFPVYSVLIPIVLASENLTYLVNIAKPWPV